jgi:hypothetical protein
MVLMGIRKEVVGRVSGFSKQYLVVMLLIVTLVVGGCRTLNEPLPTVLSGPTSQVTIQSKVSPQPVEEDLPLRPIQTAQSDPNQEPVPQTAYGYTYHRPDGNRYVTGSAPLHLSEPVDIPLAGKPAWLVGAEGTQGVVWAVVLDNGRVQAFQFDQGTYQEISIAPDKLSPGEPPLLVLRDGIPSLVTAPEDSASKLTHPAVLPDGKIAYIEENGDLVIWKDGEIGRLPVNALLDARLLVDENDRILMLSGPTERYDHAVLGDALEASSITLLETTPELRLEKVIPVEEPVVIEGIAPIWADINQDDQREIIVTRSHPQEGAQLVVLDERGEIIAEGAAIGRSYRWRNQLAVAPFGPQGVMEVVDVLTPHINGAAEFFRIVDDELKILADFPGYTSHVIGTRNLDMGLAGDFDGDGQPEVLLPSQSLTELGAISHGADGANLDWKLDLAGVLSSNLAAISAKDGSLYLGAGLDDGILRMWAFQKE